jgi:hypothetical protein
LLILVASLRLPVTIRENAHERNPQPQRTERITGLTGRHTAILAGAVVTVAGLAVVARPLIPHPTTPSSRPVSAATPTVPASVLTIATTAATGALACPSTPTPTVSVDCGTLHLTRSQNSCPTDARCQVQLVGILHTRAVDVPVALTVTLLTTNSHWHAVEVAS